MDDPTESISDAGLVFGDPCRVADQDGVDVSNEGLKDVRNVSQASVMQRKMNIQYA